MSHMKRISITLLIFVFLLSPILFSQQPVLMNSGEIKIAIKKLAVLGSVLYIAAHPDDENTSVLSWLSKEKLMRTGYLSLTRGGGGQNLIGTEKGPLMSVLRTYELLAARQIDGAQQFFTRAKDFGYSKTAEESISIWGRENIVADIVFIIRAFKPDIILSRFPPTGSGHGHHTASAILAIEAFEAAGDTSRFPEQLKYVSVWQPTRIFWNTWLPRTRNAEAADLKDLIAVDVGTFNQLLGKSYTEIAATSRSMHKSQGFGVLSRRGRQLDYYKVLAGKPAKTDLFEGINTTWDRIPGLKKVKDLINKVNLSYDPQIPYKIIPLLTEALAQMEELPTSHWLKQKDEEIRCLIRSCAGLWLEAITENAEVTPGQEIKVTTTAINRSDYNLRLKSLVIPGKFDLIPVNQTLKNNQPFSLELNTRITETEYTHPYWLEKKSQKELYLAANHQYKGLPVAPYPFNLKFIFETQNKQEISLETPILYRWRDPVEGERYRSLVVTPPVTLSFSEKVFYFPGNSPQSISLILRSGPSPVSGSVTFSHPHSWAVEPATIPFKLEEPFNEKKLTILVRPSPNEGSCTLGANITAGGLVFHHSHKIIGYPHIPIITLHPEAQVFLVKVNLKRQGKALGYIMGSGDDIPGYLSQLGYQVDILSDQDLHNKNLNQYDSIIAGIRAFNTRDILKHVHAKLLAYIASGGCLVVQYNVSRRLKVQNIGPYPFELSRNRVTEESAPVSILEPSHPLLNFPNKILASDFSGWIQERGLYFSDSWDDRYAPLLACFDKGEEPQKGGLLYCTYGKGVFIYTGFSFFRQLPAGVPGALKLFVNIIEAVRPNE